MKEEKNIERRGGRRPGAGRKAMWPEATETMSVRIPPSVRAAWVSQARSEGCTIGKLLESMLLDRAARKASAAATEKS